MTETALFQHLPIRRVAVKLMIVDYDKDILIDLKGYANGRCVTLQRALFSCDTRSK
jgi:hypothetical protein